MTYLVVLVVAPNEDVASKVGSVSVLDGIVLRNGNDQVSCAASILEVGGTRIRFKQDEGRRD